MCSEAWPKQPRHQKFLVLFFQKRTAYFLLVFIFSASAQADPDWTAERAAYAASRAYDAFAGAGAVQAAIEAALERGDAKHAASLAEQALKLNGMDVRTQQLAGASERLLGNKSRAEVHEQTAQAMLHAISMTGTGESWESAIHVLAASEELATVSDHKFGLHGQQRVLRDGHYYDLLTLRDAKSHALHVAYFNVDIPVERATDAAQARTASGTTGQHD